MMHLDQKKKEKHMFCSRREYKREFEDAAGMERSRVQMHPRGENAVPTKEVFNLMMMMSGAKKIPSNIKLIKWISIKNEDRR